MRLEKLKIIFSGSFVSAAVFKPKLTSLRSCTNWARRIFLSFNKRNLLVMWMKSMFLTVLWISWISVFFLLPSILSERFFRIQLFLEQLLLTTLVSFRWAQASVCYLELKWKRVRHEINISKFDKVYFKFSSLEWYTAVLNQNLPLASVWGKTTTFTC